MMEIHVLPEDTALGNSVLLVHHISDVPFYVEISEKLLISIGFTEETKNMRMEFTFEDYHLFLRTDRFSLRASQNCSVINTPENKRKYTTLTPAAQLVIDVIVSGDDVNHDPSDPEDICADMVNTFKMYTLDNIVPNLSPMEPYLLAEPESEPTQTTPRSMQGSLTVLPQPVQSLSKGIPTSIAGFAFDLAKKHPAAHNRDCLTMLNNVGKYGEKSEEVELFDNVLAINPESKLGLFDIFVPHPGELHSIGITTLYFDAGGVVFGIVPSNKDAYSFVNNGPSWLLELTMKNLCVDMGDYGTVTGLSVAGTYDPVEKKITSIYLYEITTKTDALAEAFGISFVGYDMFALFACRT